MFHGGGGGEGPLCLWARDLGLAIIPRKERGVCGSVLPSFRPVGEGLIRFRKRAVRVVSAEGGCGHAARDGLNRV